MLRRGKIDSPNHKYHQSVGRGPPLASVLCLLTGSDGSRLQDDPPMLRGGDDWKTLPQSVRDLDVLVHRLEHVRRLVDHRVKALGDFVRSDVLHLDLRRI